jgi:hypothetical protein
MKHLKLAQEVTRELLGGRIVDISDQLAHDQTVRLGLLRDILCGPMESISLIETTNSSVEADSESKTKD